MSIAEYVRQVFLSCPFITVDKFDMHIDFIGSKGMQYSIEAEPTSPTIKSYLDGSSIKRFSFALIGKQNAGSDKTRAKNKENYEKLSQWIEKKNYKREFPGMGADKRLLKIEPTGADYLFSRDEGSEEAVYMMQFELRYFQKMEV